jgi:hypothetical protein
VTDWVTISALATAAGTLVLAGATFMSVRSANQAARVAERALMAGMRPVLVPSRLTDEPVKVGFADNHWVKVGGGRAIVEATDDVVYLVIGLRNEGSGLAVLDRWDFHPDRTPNTEFRDVGTFRRLTRDIYVPSGDIGFWQGAFRDPADPAFMAAQEAIRERRSMTIDLLYGDVEGGQRIISRFGLVPQGETEWLASISRHRNLDRPEPR